ncbi:MAG: glycosyltransferase [Vulcanimicrobiaceae bacterium]
MPRPARPALSLERDVLLFFEDRDRDTLLRGDRHLRRRVRRSVAPLRGQRQRVSGFEMSFILLRRALEAAGRRVHVNARALALANPEFPIGLCGYTHVLEYNDLPNPAVLGPGILDHPKQRPALFDDPRYRSYLVLCEWMREMFATVYRRDTLDLWFGGIDLAMWPDVRTHDKTLDLLVYDKIRWNRDSLVPRFREPLLAELQRRGLRFEIVRYGGYSHQDFKGLLARSRGMLFLCEHETQGMAYQEALASNVPVLAWDQGYWLDPNRVLWTAEPVRASSVPYFDPACGERFAIPEAFAPALERFLERLDGYAPRAWVAEHLSFAASASLYLKAYYAAVARCSVGA